MRKILAAALLASVAFTGSPASAGCVEDHILVDSESEPPDGSIVDRYVERHPSGSVTVHPTVLTSDVLAWATVIAGNANAFVDCVV